MAERYDHRELEPRWQRRWEEEGIYRAEVDWSKPKHYALTMLPYPSGDLHIGHWYAMTPSDARARWMRMKGYNVLFPMGFDAFGLPAEQAAVQRNIHPAKWTWANIERMRRQLRSMGAMFDWRREAITCDPSFYRWTQWLFEKFYEAGIAYRGEALVNWSPTLQTVLANEQVIDGKDERTGQPVVQKLMEQWFFEITRYAEELLDFEGLDWPEPVKAMQRNWIGRSEGAEVVFRTEGGDELPVFTTRPDTLWGATFMVLAPEHPLVDGVTTPDRRAEVDAYREQTARRSELERMEEGEKTGVFTGGYAINPVNGERIPIWIADYVLLSYGSGAIMAVPAHDQRDFEFARKYGLPIVPVIQPDDGEPLDGATMTEAYVGPGVMVNSGPLDGTRCTEAKGRENPSIAAAIDWLVEHGVGREAVGYRLRDWLISRQRYWGCPIPMRYRRDGTIEPVPEAELPVVLPEDVEFTGRNPLAEHPEFVQTVDAEGRPARRETDTMDTFVDSSWYQYRYLSPDYDEGPFDPEEAAYWLPVDTYTGGAEHATLHLLYTRFFTKAMRDLGIFDETAEVMRRHGRDPDSLFDEPMLQLRNQGQVLGEERPGDVVHVVGRWRGETLVAESVRVDEHADPADADGVIVGEVMRRVENVLQVRVDDRLVTVEVPEDAVVEIPGIPGDNDVTQIRHHLEVQRMSKSRGNVVNPDELVEAYGADTVRTYLMFAYDWEKGGPWDSRGILGTRRFLDDVHRIGTERYVPKDVSEEATARLRRRVHQAIRKVDADMEAFKWNTAVATLMSLRNDLLEALRSGSVSADAWDEAVKTLLLLLAPMAPHLTEELWRGLGFDESIHLQPWPEFDPEVAREELVTLVVQVNGKVRDRLEVPADADAEAVEAAALSSERVRRWLETGEVRRIVARPPNLVNIVVG
ncbi:MAG TPA: leucine--tRNA ligase [Actinobacteria bacterium]|nr:leucine--tRNA ligase [Actinomycetota bacterium]